MVGNVQKEEEKVSNSVSIAVSEFYIKLALFFLKMNNKVLHFGIFLIEKILELLEFNKNQTIISIRYTL